MIDSAKSLGACDEPNSAAYQELPPIGLLMALGRFTGPGSLPDKIPIATPEGGRLRHPTDLNNNNCQELFLRFFRHQLP